MWNIIKTETNRKGNIENIFCFSSGNDESYDYQDILIPSTILSFQWLTK